MCIRDRSQTLPIARTRTTNREWLFKQRPGPDGFNPDTDFELTPCELPSCGDGQLVVAPYLVSVDPTLYNAMRGSDSASRTEGSAYYDFMNWATGAVPSWFMIAQVLESKADGFEPGQLVEGMAPWREVSAVDAAGWAPVTAQPEAQLSVLGLTGKTAYLGVKHIIRPSEGNTAYVSGAAGSTGLAACQTLLNLGCTVIGSAGSDEKVALLESVGVKGFNYKNESVLEGLQRLAPNGIDCAYDNVGGETLEAILEMVNEGGSVALCGAISQYDAHHSEKYGIKNTFHLIAKRVRLEGFLVNQFGGEQQKECAETLAAWVGQGKLTPQYTLVEGFENLIVGGLVGLLKGTNMGKLLVKMEL
eukprot:TRINITY_DN13584_c0_g1_i1.p1 TRINITY_DN13584_c0_g1~~TRINITY_DN13584_c0_g1_i1.p1  ORF type:complete len:360 (-),score=84.38 TRINITY_DN13584_c0_g1_i1:220-1299(-)